MVTFMRKTENKESCKKQEYKTSFEKRVFPRGYLRRHKTQKKQNGGNKK